MKPARVGILTTDPYRIAEIFEDEKIEYVILGGTNKPGEETRFVTLSRVDKNFIGADLQMWLKTHSCTEEFASLRTTEQLVAYIKENA